MSKITTIAGYELRRMVRDRGLLTLLLLLLALSGYGAWNGAVWTQQRELAIDLIKTEEEKRLAFGRRFVEQQLVVPASLAVLPPTDMAPISLGQADAYPFHAEAFALSDYSMLFKRVWGDISSPDVRAAGRFDLAFVIVFLLPLVILAATYDLWSRERERGIAAMVLSQPVAIAPLIVIKALARGLIVLGPSVVFILVVSVLAGARDPLGLTALALTVIVYGAFWVAMAVLINLVTRRSAEAAIAAGASWLFIVVMAPSLTLAVIDVARPAPSEARFTTDLKAHKTAISERLRLEREARPIQVGTSNTRIPDRLHALYADRVALDDALLPMIDAHHQAKNAHREALDAVRLFLPSVAVQDALDRIAGSDADRALSFERQARETQMALRHLYKTHLDNDTLLTLTEYDERPKFQFRETSRPLQIGFLIDIVSTLIATLVILIAIRMLRSKVATP